jgi:hypothetical protein
MRVITNRAWKMRTGGVGTSEIPDRAFPSSAPAFQLS